MTQARHQPMLDFPIPYELHQQLQHASVRTGFQQEDWELGAMAIREWLVRNDPDAFALPPTSGYQWKQLFLPTGTLLRTVFKGCNHHCRVEGDCLQFNGQATSPSGFVNAVGGVRRNAWDAIWILFPDSTTWKRAAALRPSRATRPVVRAHGGDR